MRRNSGPKQGPTVEEVVTQQSQCLAQIGVDSALLDAQLLVGLAVDMNRAELMANGSHSITPDQLKTAQSLIVRRLEGEPVAYILGQQEFWSLSFRVDRSVLIPRPETERLVELCLARFKHRSPQKILEIGTGSGAIVAALAHELSSTQFLATDISPESIQIAHHNLSALGLRERVELRESDVFDAIRPEQRFDAIVSNPPYVTTAEMEDVSPEVRLFEPIGALCGGDDGLMVTRRLVQRAHYHLTSGGWLLVEIGASQGEQVAALFRSAGLSDVCVEMDLAGLPRVVAGCFKGGSLLPFGTQP